VARALAAALLAAALAAGGAGAATPQRGGSVAVFAGPEPSCLNPFGPCTFNHAFLRLVFEGAFAVGPDLRHRPNLVSRADIVSRSPLTIVYRIRPEARWSDGVPVTASDFVFTHRIFRDYRAGGAQSLDIRPWYRTIRTVAPLDAKTVRVVFRERFADWQLLFNRVLPRHVLAGEDITAVWRNRIDDPRTGRPIGSGPFLVGSLERGRQVTLVRNPRYWRGRTSHLDRLHARFEPPSELEVRTPADAIRLRHLDVMNLLGPNPAELAELRRVPGVTVRSAPSTTLEHFVVRVGPGGHRALRNRLVRQALAHGLDRSDLARVAVGDARLKADNAVVTRSSRFYRANWSSYRHGPARARGLLEQAGCRRGADAVYVCGGERLRLRFRTAVGAAQGPRRQLTLELVKEQLRQIGVDVQPEYYPAGALFRTILERGEFDVALVNFAGPKDFLHRNLLCGSAFSGHCNRLTNRDLVQGDLILDQRVRARVLNAADAKLARDVPVIPLFTLPYVVPYRSNIRGIVPVPVAPHWNAGSWWLAP
jgi:peptide/nickel transport system substrate-binding protein